MRRVIIVLLWSVLLAQPSAGQWQVGARWGWGISSLVIPDDRTVEFLIDPGALDLGIVAKHYASRFVGFHAELNYAERGYIRRLADAEVSQRVNSYLELPMMMQVRLQGRSWYAHAHGGSYLAFLVRSVQGRGQPGAVDMRPYPLNVLYINRIDFGVVSGLGVGRRFAWGSIQLDGKYLWGFRDFYQYDYPGMPTRSIAQAISLSVGVLLDIGQLLPIGEPPTASGTR